MKQASTLDKMEPIVIVGLVLGLAALANSCSNAGKRKQKQNVEKDVEDLAINLSPSEGYIQAGKEAASSVFMLLKQNAVLLGITIARTKIAGSIGKNTGISFIDRKREQQVNPDFDCVLFINDEEPPSTILVVCQNDLCQHNCVCVVSVYESKKFGLVSMLKQNILTCVTGDTTRNDTLDTCVNCVTTTNYVKGIDLLSLRGRSVGELEAQIVQKNIWEQQKRSLAAEHEVNEQKIRMFSH
ncbi:unnamed protein product [Orchesella dallaii]|uniref:Uncharacterized protein n=1 Tax=Orchesella dallaii TaxID=48710 RepID=A0ABP1S041_9HEXA